MKNYFLLENGQHIGPFSIDELKSKKISKTELVWAEGMADWQQGGTVDELKSIFAATPPPAPKVAPPPQAAAPPPPPTQKAYAAPPPTAPAPPAYAAPPPPAPPRPQANYANQGQTNYANQAQYNTGEYIPQAGGTWIIAGYIFCVIGGFLGWVIGTHLKFSKQKLPNGAKVKKFDEESQKVGLRLLIIGGISHIIWLAILN